jgi:hypothetical protein
MVKFVYFLLFSHLFLHSCTPKKDIRNEEIPFNTILIDSINYEIDLGLIVKDIKEIWLKFFLEGSSLCRHQIISNELQELDLKSFKDLKYLSLFEPDDSQTFEEYRDLFLKDLKLFYLGTQSHDGLRLHLILQEYPGKRDTTLSNLFLLFTNKGKTYSIIAGVCSFEKMESDYESGTVYQDSTFEYRDFISKNDTIFQRYKISKNGLALYRPELKTNR